MPTRPCDFCLALQDDSVFADFRIDSAGLVALLRISFDGYGCHGIREGAARMGELESRTLIAMVTAGELDSRTLGPLLRSFFRDHQEVIGREALIDHLLLA